MCHGVEVHATNDSGVELDAKYSVVPDGEHLALILESSGGRIGDAVHGRNHEYLPALELLLGRLRDRRAVLVGAFVDSRPVQHLPEAERALISEPVVLAERDDLEKLRLELTSAQGPIGQRPGATKKGNNSKRIRLRLSVPGYAPAGAALLESDLAVAHPPAKVDIGWGDPVASFARLREHGRDKSLALLWAIGQVVAGHDRVFPWAEFRVDAGRVLAGFGVEEPEAPFWGLGAESALWETGERGGFTRSVAERLGDRGFRGRVVDVLHREYLADVDFRALLGSVGLADHDLAPPSALDVLRCLVGKQLFTVTGKPNRIIRVDPDVVRVGTRRSEAGEPVRVAAIQKGLDLLRENGSVRIHPDALGHRSSFIGAVLATVPGAVASTGPAMITMAGPADIPVCEGARFAVLDGKAVRKYRKEQGYLRRFLVGDRLQASCDLCGQDFPMGFLVAAHVKPRSLCTDEERNDLRNVAMLACGFGCDRLYEDGYLAVDENGRVLATPGTVELGAAVSEYLRRLEGLRCAAHRLGSERYFAWHRENVYRRGPATA